MEIYLQSQEKQIEIASLIEANKSIRIVSDDDHDKGKFYLIDTSDIISIDEDCEGMIIWWKQYSHLEGRHFTNSAHFVNYEFVWIFL